MRSLCHRLSLQPAEKVLLPLAAGKVAACLSMGRRSPLVLRGSGNANQQLATGTMTVLALLNIGSNRDT
ncbi:MAG: hypothetical protein ACI9EF_000735 [Pseudohongiellaceae bacterium]|jgi:hypothetical protein